VYNFGGDFRRGEEVDKQKISDVQDEVAIQLWDGDETVLEVILDEYAPSIMKSLGYRYSLFSTEDLEDIVCEAIKRLWAKREKYDDSRGSIKALLYRIADNIAKDILKSGWQKLQEKREYCDNKTLEELAIVYTDEEDKISKDYDSPFNVDLREIIDSLPEVQQKIIKAFALAPEGEINSAIIGRELRRPAVTIRVNFKRGKEKICSEMKKRGHDIGNMRS
jgi:RNA polymerase sigma factor (sigma-70 family)